MPSNRYAFNVLYQYLFTIKSILTSSSIFIIFPFHSLCFQTIFTSKPEKKKKKKNVINTTNFLKLKSSQHANIASDEKLMAHSYTKHIIHLSHSITKPIKHMLRPAKIQINLVSLAVLSRSSLGTLWATKEPKLLHAHSEASDQPVHLCRLLRIFNVCIRSFGQADMSYYGLSRK